MCGIGACAFDPLGGPPCESGLIVSGGFFSFFEGSNMKTVWRAFNWLPIIGIAGEFGYATTFG